MAKSVQDLPKDIHKLIEVYEWDMRTLTGIKRYRELKARSLPSIALDGELAYESLIPPQEEICAKITNRWKIKNNGVSP